MALRLRLSGSNLMRKTTGSGTMLQLYVPFSWFPRVRLALSDLFGLLEP